MFDELSRDEMEDLLDLESTEHPADGAGAPADGPTCGTCLCCYGGCGCCSVAH